jgi:hypothetical protein
VKLVVVVLPLPAPMKVALSPVPGTVTKSVSQLALVAHTPFTEPSQALLLAREFAAPARSTSARTLEKANDLLTSRPPENVRGDSFFVLRVLMTVGGLFRMGKRW